MVAGGIAGAIPGILRAYLGTSEVIVTIMMNYIILYVANNIIRFGFTADMLRSSEASNKVVASASYQNRVLISNNWWFAFQYWFLPGSCSCLLSLVLA